MTGQPIILFGVIVVLIIAAVIWMAVKTRSPRGVVPLSGRKKLTMQKQSCSYCKRKVNPKELTFYAGPVRGKVVGVCKACKPQAERQSLMRL